MRGTLSAYTHLPMITIELPTDYQSESYEAVSPAVADNDELAMKGRRVILQHVRTGPNQRLARLIVAPQGQLNSGWVIGVIRD